MSRRKHRKKSERSQQGDEAEVETAGASAGSDGSPSERESSASTSTEEGAASAGNEERGDEAEPGHGSSAEKLDELEDLRARAEEMRELAQRKQAEFENYRKRVERERTETVQYASSELLREVLPVLDNLERALAAAESGGGEEQLHEGVSIIYRQFKDILEKRGLAELDTEGKPFDPHVHEAVSRVETNEYPEGTVVDVLQKGYWFKDRLLRPAMVSVALPASGEDASDD